MTNEPRSGVNPAPVILVQLVSLNLLRLFTASIHINTSLIFVSDSLDVRSLSISPKSSTLMVLLSRIDVMMATSSSFLLSMEFFRATAKRAREGMARKLATCDNTPVGTADIEQHLVIVGVSEFEVFEVLMLICSSKNKIMRNEVKMTKK